MKVLIKKEIGGYKPNTIVNVNEKDYTSMAYWYRRLEDAKIDKSCELVKENKKTEKAESSSNVVQSESETSKKKERYSVK